MKHLDLDRETQMIILFVINDGLHHSKNINFNNVNWNIILRRASLNRVLYQFTKNALETLEVSKSPIVKKNFSLIRSEGNEYLNKLGNTIEFITSSFSNADISFLIVKTYRDLPYVTLDVDVLVCPDEYERAERVLKRAGCKIERCQSKLQSDAILQGLLRIDLHKGFFWQGSDYIDPQLVWEKPREQKIQGKECMIPNLEVEVVLTIVHILYERLHITLLDFLFIKNASEKVNWSIILDQAEKYGWIRALLRFISLINELNSRLYPEEKESLMQFHGNKFSIPNCQIGVPVSMPYMYPVRYAFDIFWERIFTRRYIPKFDVAYYLFTKFRYHYSRKLRVPIYDHWFNFKNLEWHDI